MMAGIIYLALSVETAPSHDLSPCSLPHFTSDLSVFPMSSGLEVQHPFETVRCGGAILPRPCGAWGSRSGHLFGP